MINLGPSPLEARDALPRIPWHPAIYAEAVGRSRLERKIEQDGKKKDHPEKVQSGTGGS